MKEQNLREKDLHEAWMTYISSSNLLRTSCRMLPKEDEKKKTIIAKKKVNRSLDKIKLLVRWKIIQWARIVLCSSLDIL